MQRRKCDIDPIIWSADNVEISLCIAICKLEELGDLQKGKVLYLLLYYLLNVYYLL